MYRIVRNFKRSHVLNALAHGQILKLILNALGGLSLRLAKQLQIIVGHQARQIRLPILIRAVFVQLDLAKKKRKRLKQFWD